MITEAYRRLFWGFFLILMDFRIGGFDILPDVVGYLFFAGALKTLADQSEFFAKGISLNTLMMFLSIFTIYERPNQQQGIHLMEGFLGPIGSMLAFVGFFVSLLLVYRIFMGIRDMAVNNQRQDLGLEGEKRWKQFLFLQFGLLFALFFLIVPPLAVLYIIAVLVFSLVYIFLVLGFLKRCREAFSHLDERM